MSVLVCGMKMPKNCEECDFASMEDVDFDYSLYCKCSKKYCDLDALWHPIGWNCPLVEVPPHGRLVDADALIAKKRKLYCDNCILRTGIKNGKKQFVYEIGAAPCRGCWIDDMVTELQDAPTIIDAEGGDT